MPSQQSSPANVTSQPRIYQIVLLLGIATAVFLRFYQLESAPPGLYRDEAFNGIDALGVLEGEYALIFPANNGREPLYIYLTAVFTAFFGASPLAVRFAAALVGSLTVIPLFLLARDWFNPRVAIITVWLWAMTLWPIHLSRIGLRVILLAPFLALTAWLATRAYRQQQWWLWLLAGCAYGAAFYTYLAARFTPLLLLAAVAYLWLTGRGKKLWPGLFWLGLGVGLLLLPLVWIFLRDPTLLLGRTGQVFIFGEAESVMELWQLIWGQTTVVLGLFFWRGDDILRHNPANRPLFDVAMAIPFFLGLVACLRRWRHPPAALLLLWVSIMLGPTFLAADAPHFLRVAGILPVVVILPAVGLGWIWDGGREGFTRQASTGDQLRMTDYQKLITIFLLAVSAFLTLRDYAAYVQQPDVGYLFEAAARELAEDVLSQSSEMAPSTSPGQAIFLQKRLADGWPSIPYLLHNREIMLFEPAAPPPLPKPPFSVYRWPFNETDWLLETAVLPPALITVQQGGLARGDLEPEPYPLYVKTAVQPITPAPSPLARFENDFVLHGASLTQLDAQTLLVILRWEAVTPQSSLPTAFLQVVGEAGLIGQLDAPTGQELWLPEGWQAGIMVQEQRRIMLSEPFSPDVHQVLVGLYDPQTAVRFRLVGEDGELLGDAYEIQK